MSGHQPKTGHPLDPYKTILPPGGTGIQQVPPGYEGVALEEVRSALGNGADERMWPPGLSPGQAVARLVAILEEVRETERLQAEEDAKRLFPDLWPEEGYR